MFSCLWNFTVDPNNNIGNWKSGTPMYCYCCGSHDGHGGFGSSLKPSKWLAYPRPLVYQYSCVLCALGWYWSPSWVDFVAYTLIVSTSLLCLKWSGAGPLLCRLIIIVGMLRGWYLPLLGDQAQCFIVAYYCTVLTDSEGGGFELKWR